MEMVWPMDGAELPSEAAYMVPKSVVCLRRPLPWIGLTIDLR